MSVRRQHSRLRPFHQRVKPLFHFLKAFAGQLLLLIQRVIPRRHRLRSQRFPGQRTAHVLQEDHSGNAVKDSVVNVHEQPGVLTAGIHLQPVQALVHQVKGTDSLLEEGFIRLFRQCGHADLRRFPVVPPLHDVSVPILKPGPQRRMRADRLPYCLRQRFALRVFKEADVRDVILRGSLVQLPVHQDAPLVFCDWIILLLLPGTQGCFPFIFMGTRFRDGTDGGLLQDFRRPDAHTEPLRRLRRQPHGPDGGKPQRHQVCRDAKFLCSQDPRRDFKQRFFRLRFRRHDLPQVRQHRLRQRFPVNLAGGRQRHLRQFHIGCRHHVIRQRFRQECFQSFPESVCIFI